jgi:hypothetical protein
MDGEKFIDAIRIAVRDSAISGSLSNLKKPPGRRPSLDSIAVSEWYDHLDQNSKKFVEITIKSAVDTAIFNLLCVIDGVISIESSIDKKKLQLWAIGSDSTLLNGDSNRMLHDIYMDK